MSEISPKEQLSNFISLISSDEWSQFIAIKEEHAECLQKEINRHLAEGNYRLADRAQAKLEDNMRDIELLNKRMQELKRLMPQEEGFK